MHDLIEKYAPDAKPRNGRMPCPLHGGMNYNFGYDRNVYHCFVCGNKGDVIGFVRDMFGLDFMGAVGRINDDFQLALPLDRRPTLREQRDAQRRQMERLERAEERQRIEDEKRRQNELYWQLWDEWTRLDRNRAIYAPQSPEDEINPLFVEALHKIDHVEYLIDELL